MIQIKLFKVIERLNPDDNFGMSLSDLNKSVCVCGRGWGSVFLGLYELHLISLIEAQIKTQLN